MMLNASQRPSVNAAERRNKMSIERGVLTTLSKRFDAGFAHSNTNIVVLVQSLKAVGDAGDRYRVSFNDGETNITV